MTLFIATLVLAVGTLVFRLAGPLLRERMALSAKVEARTNRATVVLLAALVATTATQGGDSVACPAGVLVGGVLARRRAPFVVVVLAAAATAAGLRLLGVP